MALSIASFPLFNPQLRVLKSFNPSSRTITTSSRLPTHLNATKDYSVCEPLPPDRPLWFPGSSPPEWLDGSLPGDFGFDPLGLGSDPELLRWFAQAELMHSRWAMLAVAGILIPECLERLEFIENFSWYDAGAQTYFADPLTLFVVQMIVMGWAEGRRWADYVRPGCVDIEPEFPNRKKPKPDVGYPGGLWFDPLMWGRGSPEPVMVMRTKEIKNGRLAMLAFVGFCFQAVYTGEGPLENLSAHLADPGHCNIFQPRLGWSETALVLGAKDVGISPSIIGSFPRKEAALVEFFMDDCLQKLIDRIDSDVELDKLILSNRLSKLTRIRLEMQTPYISKWPQALSIQAQPANLPTSFKQRAILIDEIWHAAGDQGSDVDWYVKRTLLGGIYSTSEVYMLTDHSPGFRETWNFLENRIKDAFDLQKTVQEATYLAEAVGAGIGNSMQGFMKRVFQK